MDGYFEKTSEKIKAGQDYTLYLLYCVDCHKYKRICSSPPAGPGGTLSCPLCRERNEHGPHIESAYGTVRVKRFTIVLPEEVEVK